MRPKDIQQQLATCKELVHCPNQARGDINQVAVSEAGGSQAMEEGSSIRAWLAELTWWDSGRVESRERERE